MRYYFSLLFLSFSICVLIAQENKSVSGVDVLYNLPLVTIDTKGIDIPDEPRIRATMKIIDNGPEEGNKQFGIPNAYDGYISIERRGESSSGFPKKSYSLELQNADSSNNNMSIFGLPAENDFVLYAPYSDKTFLRNVLVYMLYNEMGNWAPKTRFVELFLNGQYKGIYVWMEKIKRDENRVDIDKLTAEDEIAPDLTGGYILRRDKTNGMEPYEYWKSPVKQIYYEPLTYQYFDPDYYELTEKQRSYIRDYMQEFDEMMSGSDFDHPEMGYRSYIDVQSFVDMMIVNEFSKGLDAYMFSTYFFKQNDEDGGLLFAGPPWDYNISLDNVNYGYDHNIPYVHSWVYDNWSRVYWWQRLMEDEDFEWDVLCRWEELRHKVLNTNYIMTFIDNSVKYMGPAISRNFSQWPILGTYVWPNNKWPNTYSEEIQNMKLWIEARLNWIDDEWGGACEWVDRDEKILADVRLEFEIRVRPNPSDLSNTFIDLKNIPESKFIHLDIIDVKGTRVYSKEISNINHSYEAINLPDLSYLTNGVYLIRLVNEHGFITSERMLKIK